MLLEPVAHAEPKDLDRAHEILRLALRYGRGSLVLRRIPPFVALHERDHDGLVGAAGVLQHLEGDGTMTFSLNWAVTVCAQRRHGKGERRGVRKPEPTAGAERGRATVAQRLLCVGQQTLDLVPRGWLSVQRPGLDEVLEICVG